MTRKKYILLRDATKDKPLKKFAAGEIVSTSDFPASVLAQWAADGFAEEIENEGGAGDGEGKE